MEQKDYKPKMETGLVVGRVEATECHKGAAASSGEEGEKQQQQQEEQPKGLVASSKEMRKMGLI